MAKQKLEKFVELVLKSRLVEHDRLARALAEFKREAVPEERANSDAFAERLISAGHVTRWQCDKLQEGRYKTFFLGKYRLLGHLGAGGMSNVYLAEHTVMNRRVALKVLPKNRVDDTSYLGRFRREAQAAAVLDHRNIVRAYDIDNEDDIHYLVMEYVDGRDLHGVVKSDGPLDYALAADYIAQAAEGLDHAHQAGLIHRDVKPANLLLDSRGVVKVSDLGLARFSDSEKASLTIEHNENVLGTADYLAPEQALNSHSSDTRADIYSLGCTLYFLLTGHPPFPDGTLPQRLMMHQSQDPPDIQIDRPDAPPRLVEICRTMMAKSPADRYQQVHEVAVALRDWLATVGAPGRPPGSGSKPRLAGGARGPADTGPASGKSPGDTVSNQERGTIKGPVKNPPSERRSDSSKQKAKALPVARSISESPYADLEAVIGSDRSSGRMRTESGRGRDSARSQEPVPRDRPVEGSSIGSRISSRSTPHEAPKWLWLAVAGGIVMTVLLIVLMIVVGGR